MAKMSIVRTFDLARRYMRERIRVECCNFGTPEMRRSMETFLLHQSVEQLADFLRDFAQNWRTVTDRLDLVGDDFDRVACEVARGDKKSTITYSLAFGSALSVRAPIFWIEGSTKKMDALRTLLFVGWKQRETRIPSRYTMVDK